MLTSRVLCLFLPPPLSSFLPPLFSLGIIPPISTFSERDTALAMPYCDRCDRSFRSRHALQQHLDNSSNHNICDDCDKDFETDWALTQHYIQSPYHHYCQHCDEDFDDEDELDDHLEEEHWYCRDCDKVRVHWLRIIIHGTHGSTLGFQFR